MVMRAQDLIKVLTTSSLLPMIMVGLLIWIALTDTVHEEGVEGHEEDDDLLASSPVTGRALASSPVTGTALATERLDNDLLYVEMKSQIMACSQGIISPSLAKHRCLCYGPPESGLE